MHKMVLHLSSKNFTKTWYTHQNASITVRNWPWASLMFSVSALLLQRFLTTGRVWFRIVLQTSWSRRYKEHTLLKWKQFDIVIMTAHINYILKFEVNRSLISYESGFRSSTTSSIGKGYSSPGRAFKSTKY